MTLNKTPLINKTVLMSDARHFSALQAINPFMDQSLPTDTSLATEEHDRVKEAFESAGIEVIKVASPEGCQDGIYTANWALVEGDLAVVSNLPNARQAEQGYARQVLRDLGKEIIEIPSEYKFSGQGDALKCGKYLFCGSVYRSDEQAQQFVADVLGLNRVQLQTKPLLDSNGNLVINQFSGWPDSYYYDIDLALSVIKPPTETSNGLIAWCPAAFTEDSQAIIRSMNDIDKIEVSETEAKQYFACNLVSTASVVIMNTGAKQLATSLRAVGLEVIELSNPEIGKGGGSIRCVSLSLD